MNNTTLTILLGAGLGLAASCVHTTYALDPDHCNSNDGDEFCGRQYADGSRPFCRLGTESCMDAGGITDVDHDGCVAERPEDSCYSACGGGRSIEDDLDCMPVADGGDSESGSGTGGADTTADTTMSGDATEGMDATAGTTEGETDDGPTTGAECTDSTECGGATPFCDAEGACVACDGMPDPDAACGDADASLPVCEGGECVQCREENAAACEGQTPVCGADNTCAPCIEHSECPDTACHLDGPDVGSCFAAGDVVMASSSAQLQAAFAGASADDDVVVVLTGASYTGVSIDFVTNAEVAVLGDGSQDISGNTSGGIISTGGSSIVYVAGVSVAGNISGDGLACSGTSVWLDDSEVRNNAQVGLDISGGCGAHLRRSTVYANNAGGIDIAGGGLQLVGSAVGLNGNDLTSSIGGIRLDGTAVDVRYSTIAGNAATNSTRASLFCIGGESGEVRNSILVADGTSISGCSGLTFGGNAADAVLGGTNGNVGAIMAGWFADLASGDFRLSATGATTFADIAQWEEGDPLTDIDGEDIETVMASYPGYDQP